MTLKEEIQSILNDPSLDYDAKGERLAKIITKQELKALLPKATEVVELKEPISAKKTARRNLNLSIHNVFFEAIRSGKKKAEYRDYKQYYIDKCTYVEKGKRYIVPYDTITFYVGKAKRMTVEVKDIKVAGGYFVFYLGRVLS